jgi:hypothetical protein
MIQIGADATYRGLRLQAIDRSLWQTHDLYSITIEFRRECTGDDVVDSVVHAEQTASDGSHENVQAKQPQVELSFLHSLCLQESGEEVARARTHWRLRKENRGPAGAFQKNAASETPLELKPSRGHKEL